MGKVITKDGIMDCYKLLITIGKKSTWIEQRIFNDKAFNDKAFFFPTA